MGNPVRKSVEHNYGTQSGPKYDRFMSDEHLSLPDTYYERNYPGTVDTVIIKYEKQLYSGNSYVSLEASRQLAKIGFLAVRVLTKALKANINHVAINAANAIKTIGPNAKTAIFDLTWMLHYRAKECREIAAATLGQLKSIPCVSVLALARALTDNETTVRQYAAAALGEFSGDDLAYGIYELKFAVHDIDDHVRTFAQYALSKTGN